MKAICPSLLKGKDRTTLGLLFSSGTKANREILVQKAPAAITTLHK